MLDEHQAELGVGEGWEALEGEDICIHKADSCCCSQKLTQHDKANMLQ